MFNAVSKHSDTCRQRHTIALPQSAWRRRPPCTGRRLQDVGRAHVVGRWRASEQWRSCNWNTVRRYIAIPTTASQALARRRRSTSLDTSLASTHTQTHTHHRQLYYSGPADYTTYTRIDWLEFNGIFSTVRLYRAFRSTYSLRFGK